MRSVQLPFTQGLGSHSSIGSISQNLPVSRGVWVQVKLPTISLHVPPFKQRSG